MPEVKCPECGTEYSDAIAEVCPKCSLPRNKVWGCNRCGAWLHGTIAVCPGCGASRSEWDDLPRRRRDPSRPIRAPRAMRDRRATAGYAEQHLERKDTPLRPPGLGMWILIVLGGMFGFCFLSSAVIGGWGDETQRTPLSLIIRLIFIALGLGLLRASWKASQGKPQWRRSK